VSDEYGEWAAGVLRLFEENPDCETYADLRRKLKPGE
jgi:hypothetical protein